MIMNYYLVRKNPHILPLKFEHFTITLYRALRPNEVYIYIYIA